MEYIKGVPYFSDGEKISQFPYLDKDISCDILIVGGGIDGAIANYYLSKKFDVCLVDKSRFGMGCTSVATALLEYQLDDYFFDLPLTEVEVEDVYRMGLWSVEQIEAFIKEHGNKCGFRKVPSFLYTLSKFKSKNIVKEFKFRRERGFSVNLLKNEKFDFEYKTGLYCENGGAEFNPYLFTKQLLEVSSNKDKMFENTEIDSFLNGKSKKIAKTNFGQTIECKKIIFATGFNFELLRKKNLCKRDVSYTIVTNAVKDFKIYNNALLQDDQSPYHYIRHLPDGRIMVGGEDVGFDGKVISEKIAEKKYKALEDYLYLLFPKLKGKVKIEYKFCGCFGSTENNLGLIGKTEDENVLYLISCGANGIINAIYGAKLLEDVILGKKNPFEKLFSPLRD